jgi:hypothetical protein
LIFKDKNFSRNTKLVRIRFITHKPFKDKMCSCLLRDHVMGEGEGFGEYKGKGKEGRKR